MYDLAAAVRSVRHDSTIAWDALRQRMPLTYEEADRILESEAECRAEAGMGYVCGGGYAHDANLAYSMGQTDEQIDIVSRAHAAVRLMSDTCSPSDLWLDSLFTRRFTPALPINDYDDIPF